jgi:hypothetical protein
MTGWGKGIRTPIHGVRFGTLARNEGKRKEDQYNEDIKKI